MPHYFFDIHDESCTVDEVGEELDSRHAALTKATELFADILKQVDGRMEFGKDVRIVVRDENHVPQIELKIIAKPINPP